MMLSSVVFPQPDGPRITMNSPSRMSRWTSSSTYVRLPFASKILFTPWTLTFTCASCGTSFSAALIEEPSSEI
jgi:hypothetical protein